MPSQIARVSPAGQCQTVAGSKGEMRTAGPVLPIRQLKLLGP